MSIPSIPQIIGAAVQGALHDTQAALARMGQGIQQAPAFDPSAAAQGQENTGQDPLGLIGQRLAQEAQAQARGVTTLPFVGQVHYGALPLPLRVPAQAGATLDDLAGMTGEVLQNAGRTAAGTYAAANAAARLVGQQGPLSGLPGGAQDPTSQAHAEVGQGPAILRTFLQSGPIAAEQQAQQFAQQNGNGLDPEGLAGALASTLPGQEVGLPAELAANAPRLAALVDALNAASRASVKPFQAAPVLHPLEATGLPALRRALANGDAAAAELGAPVRIAGSGATPPGPEPTGPPNPLNLPATVTRRADYNQAARALGVPQLRDLPEEPSPLTPKGFSPFLAARQLAAQKAEQEAAAQAATQAAQTAGITARTPVPLPPRIGVLGDWVGRATDNTLRDTPLGNGPAQLPQPNVLAALAEAQLQHLPPKAVELPPPPKPVQPVAALVNAAQQSAKPNPLEQLLGAAQGVAARDVTPKPSLAQIEAAFPKADTGGQLALPDLPTAPETGAQGQLRANVDNSPAPLSEVANSPLAAMRALIVGGDGGKMGGYAPTNADFYAKRLGIPDEQVPALLDQLVQEGTLGRLPDGALGIKPADTGIPPEALSAAQEAQAAGFDYPADQPLPRTPMPDFPAHSGNRAEILRALPPEQIDTLLNLAYGPDEAVANALTKYPDPADLVDAALQRITTDRAKVARLSQTDPALAKTIAFLPDAAEQGAQTAPAAVTAPRTLPALLGATGMGIVPPVFNTPPMLALGNAVGGAASHLVGKPAAIKAMLADAADAQRTANASSNGLFPGGLGGIVPALRVAKKTAALVPLRNLIGNGVNVAAAGEVTPAAYLSDVSQMFDRMPQYLAALKAANALTGQARGAAQERAFLQILPDQWQQLRGQYGDDAIMGVLHKLGEDYQRFDQQAANIPWQQGAMRGALFDMLGPGAFTGPVGLATGAVRGALLPARARLQTDLLTPIDKGARLSVAYRALTDALAHGATIDQAGDAAGAAAKHALGDYTTRSRGMAAFDTLAPGARWNLEQGKILGRVVGDHPGLAVAAAIAAANGDAPRPDLADPRHTMTLQFDDKTPGLGPVARAMNGGAAGQVNVNPLYPFSPIGGDLLNVAYDIAHPERHPLENPIQQALDLLDAGGVSVNPLLAALLHKGGIVGQGPSNPDRLAKAGEAGDVLLRGWLDANTPQGSKLRLAGYIPTLANLFASSSEQNPDATDILAGRVHDPTVDKAVNEIVFEQSGKPLLDPSNRAYVEQTFDPNSPLMRQATARGGRQLVAQALSSNFAPGPVDGTTDTAHQAAVAQEALVAAGLAPDQIKQLEVATGNPLVDVQAQMLADMAGAGLPAVRIYADLSMKDRGQLLLNFWEHEHDFANAVAPGVTGAYRQQEQQRLGLIPAGTLAQQVQGYDLAAQGLTPGNGPLVRPPYLQGLNLDTLFPHPGQPAATPYTPYLLPPGAGRP